MMPDLLNYLDYRKYLSDYFFEQKKLHSYFSYRYLGDKVHIPAGNLVKILQYERHLSAKAADRFINYLKLDQKRKRYFGLLLAFNKAKKDADIKKHFETLIGMQELKTVQLKGAQYKFYQKWYHTAIAGLLYFFDFKGNYTLLASQLSPPISEHQARESLSLLCNLGIVTKDKNGRYRPENEIITTGEKWHDIAIQQFQESVFLLAHESLGRHPKESRDMSTLTVTVSDAALEEIRELGREYRKNVLEVVKACDNPDRVMQVNLQLFPLTQTGGAI
ncbi:MAG: TIGR02147 family protein [Fibrobacteria bacterium]|nr:TIGR02147 family protein [Fibrobacteria bacterium]